ncbi:hypothetical protein UlMin_025316 [Ulmus minor]
MTNSIAWSFNESFIVLISKKPNPTRLNHFRPILVCNVAIHSMKKKGSLGWMALKIDLEKAYDRGDLLSPYLFILCTEILSRLFMSKVDNGVIHGFKLSRGGPPLHYLMFADDIFVFGKACITKANHIKETVDSFCSWSGLSFNNSKSSIFFSGNTRGSVANQLTAFLGFERIPMDSCYLVECLDLKLAAWKSRLLSKASRLTLIKSVALAMPIYAMHTARIPKAICADLDARIRRFWWGSKEENARSLCLKAWDDFYFSQCLLFLQGKYLSSASFKSVEAMPADSTFWKAILKSRDALLRGACFQIGDVACMVKDLFSHSGHWDTRKVRSIFLPADASNILSIQLPILPTRDYWCWLLVSSGKFSASSFYLFVNNHNFAAASNIPKKIWLSIWNANILPRHKLLWWQILSNCLPTRTRLNRCFPDIDTQCPLCSQGSESLFHLLLYCDIVKLIWFSSPWNIRPDSISNLNCGNLLLFASILFDLVWKSRNEVIHEGCIPDPLGLIRIIIKSYNDINCSLTRPVSLHATWNPPPQDWLKFSMDVAVGVSCSCVAIVVRDHVGSLLFWKSSKVVSMDPVFVEA